jgi:hypothetical protein
MTDRPRSPAEPRRRRAVRLRRRGQSRARAPRSLTPALATAAPRCSRPRAARASRSLHPPMGAATCRPAPRLPIPCSTTTVRRMCRLSTIWGLCRGAGGPPASAVLAPCTSVASEDRLLPALYRSSRPRPSRGPMSRTPRGAPSRPIGGLRPRSTGGRGSEPGIASRRMAAREDLLEPLGLRRRAPEGLGRDAIDRVASGDRSPAAAWRVVRVRRGRGHSPQLPHRRREGRALALWMGLARGPSKTRGGPGPPRASGPGGRPRGRPPLAAQVGALPPLPELRLADLPGGHGVEHGSLPTLRMRSTAADEDLGRRRGTVPTAAPDGADRVGEDRAEAPARALGVALAGASKWLRRRSRRRADTPGVRAALGRFPLLRRPLQDFGSAAAAEA